MEKMAIRAARKMIERLMVEECEILMAGADEEKAIQASKVKLAAGLAQLGISPEKFETVIDEWARKDETACDQMYFAFSTMAA